MSEARSKSETPASRLCKSCGLCCTGHLFVWSKLRSSELEPAEALGLNVIREPRQRGFSQPCPVWDGQCTIYESPHYPRFCHTYKCKLLKELIDGSVRLTESSAVIVVAKRMIEELEAYLPASTSIGFRERLVAQIEKLDEMGEQDERGRDFRSKADALLLLFEERFGVKDFLE